MKDLNFFEPFLEKKRFRLSGVTVLYGVLALVVVGMVIVVAANQLKVSLLQKEVQKQMDFIDDPTITAKVEELEAIQQDISTFRREIDNIKALETSIAAEDIVRRDLFMDIGSRIPEDLFINNLSVDKTGIRIGGYSLDREAVARFAKGLEDLPIIEDSFISSISADESYYRFDLNLILKEVSSYGSTQ
jgi:Tfp pilus assembly protein PilN